MTRSNKTAQNPAKSRIKSLKCVTPEKATWRKWHNQTRLLTRQAADERRHDRLFGRFGIIHHVTTTRSRFCVTVLFQLPLLSTCHHQPVPSTCYTNQPSTSHHQPVIQSVPSYQFRLAVHPLNQHCNQHISRWSLLFILFVIVLVMSSRLSPPVIALLLYRQD